MQFILTEADADPKVDGQGRIVGTGLMGAIGESHRYLRVFAFYYDLRRPSHLSIGEGLRLVRFSHDRRRAYTVWRIS